MIWSRLKNLWKLSEYEPGQPNEEYKNPGTQISMIVKKPPQPQKAQFIPFTKKTPIEQVKEVADKTI